MSKFSLFGDLLKPVVENNQKPAEPEIKIAYEEYDVVVEGKEVGVSIPTREVEAFESALLNQGPSLSAEQLREILRQFRGIRTDTKRLF